jgi:hypothetical protein
MLEKINTEFPDKIFGNGIEIYLFFLCFICFAKNALIKGLFSIALIIIYSSWEYVPISRI